MVLKSNFVFVEGLNGGRFPFSNSLFVKGLRKTMLIDVGVGFDVLIKFKDRVDLVVITHLHPDHFALSYFFKGKRVYIPTVESKYKNLLDLAYRYVGEELADTWLSLVKDVMKAKDPYFTGVYEEGDVFDLGGVEVYPIYAPGHTVGHHVMLVDNDVVYGADIDLTGFGPWYGHVESNIEDFKKSIRKVIGLEPKIYVSGHKPPIKGREKILEELEKYLRKFDENGMKILEALREPRSLDELVEMNLIYRRKPYAPMLLEYWEKNMILHHLKMLIKHDFVKKMEDGKYVARI